MWPTMVLGRVKDKCYEGEIEKRETGHWRKPADINAGADMYRDERKSPVQIVFNNLDKTLWSLNPAGSLSAYLIHSTIGETCARHH